LDEDAYDVIIAMTGSSELEQMKETYREEGGTINMCEAIRGMIEQGVEQGMNQFAALTAELLKSSRTDDLLKAANDRQFREQLFREYGIGNKNNLH